MIQHKYEIGKIHCKREITKNFVHPEVYIPMEITFIGKKKLPKKFLDVYKLNYPYRNPHFSLKVK